MDDRKKKSIKTIQLQPKGPKATTAFLKNLFKLHVSQNPLKMVVAGLKVKYLWQ